MITFKEYFKIDESDSGLAAKAAKSGISIGTLRKVYNRGMAAWNSGHRPGTTPQQWAMARVNSYISHGSGTYGGADKDLHEGDTSKLPRVAKDKESGLAKKYVAGLSTSTAKARAAHFDKMDKLSDSDPAAYAPAPGDATAKTKESKFTKKYHAMYGEEIQENGLWANIHAKRARIKAGSGEKMRKPGSKGAPTAAQIASAKTNEDWSQKYKKSINCAHPKGFSQKAHCASKKQHNESIELKMVCPECGISEDLEYISIDDERFDLIEDVVSELAFINNVDPEILWEKLEELTDEELLEYAVDAKGYKSSTGGLTQKGRDAYNSKGAHLKAPVTTPPSKLNPGSKAAKRRKSFCARMSGVDGPMTKPNGKPTRKALALRKWNC
jgi:hypothetical protein